jgi:hypothetical protein
VADSKGETSAAGEDVRSTPAERRATGKTGETDEDEKMGQRGSAVL